MEEKIRAQIKEFEQFEFMAKQLLSVFGPKSTKEIAILCDDRLFALKKTLPSYKEIQNQIDLFDEKHI